MPGDHSRLFPPSSSKRWLSCFASAILNAEAPRDESGPEAQQGTLAHYVCEATIRAWWLYLQGEIDDVSLTRTQSLYGGTEGTARVDEIMVEHTQGYVDAITEDAAQPGAKVFIEQRIDYSRALGLPYGCAFGSGDAIVYLPEQRLLRAYDFKYGKWEVEPEHNTQVLCYLLAALEKFGHLFDVKFCEIVIWQPRVEGRKNPRVSWEVTPEQVTAFGTWARGKARKVLTAEEYYVAGGQEHIPINLFNATDENCQFCRATKCKARRDLIFK